MITLVIKSGRKRGFTLIELLVVIAIIAILAAILFPVFATAKKKARQTTCTNNLRQIGSGFHQYCNDWNGRLPNWWAWIPPYPMYWAVEIAPYTGMRGSVYAILHKIKSGQSIMTCPSQIAEHRKTPDKRTYGMNNYVRVNLAKPFNGSQSDYDYKNPQLPKIESPLYPTKTCLISDSIWSGWWGGNDFVHYTGDGWYGSGIPEKPHNEGTNCLFFDGHANWIKHTPRLYDKDPNGTPAYYRFWQGK